MRAISKTAGNGERAGSGFSHARQFIPRIHQFSTVRARTGGLPRRDSHLENSVRDAFASQLFAGHFQNESFKLCARQVLAYAFQPAHEILAHTILSRIESLVTDSKRAEDRLTAGSYRLLWK